MVLGGLSLGGGPMLWWVFFRMDENKTYDAPSEEGDATPVSEADVARIETTLNVVLPAPLRDFLKTERDAELVDFMTVAGTAEIIIEMTTEFRNGVGKFPKWPSHWVCFGDDGSGCPHVIDCKTSEVLCLDHGDSRATIWTRSSFEDFIRHEEKISREAIAQAAEDGPIDPTGGIPPWMYGFRGVLAVTGFLLAVSAVIVLGIQLAGGFDGN